MNGMHIVSFPYLTYLSLSLIEHLARQRGLEFLLAMVIRNRTFRAVKNFEKCPVPFFEPYPQLTYRLLELLERKRERERQAKLVDSRPSLSRILYLLLLLP